MCMLEKMRLVKNSSGKFKEIFHGLHQRVALLFISSIFEEENKTIELLMLFLIGQETNDVFLNFLDIYTRIFTVCYFIYNFWKIFEINKNSKWNLTIF